MKPPTSSNGAGVPPSSGRIVSRLLELGLQQERRPVDAVVDRLLREDGEAWLGRCVAGAFDGDEGAGREALLECGSDAETLDRVKRDAKRAGLDAESEEARLAAVLVYFLAVACAWRAHGKRLSSRPLTDVRAALTELAGALPAPWGERVGETARSMGPGEQRSA